MNDDKNTQPKDPENFGGGSLEYVAGYWDRLPPHIREAIVTLVDAAVATFSSERIHSHEDDEG